MSMNEATVYVVDDDAGALASLTFLIESVDLVCVPFTSAMDFLAEHDPNVIGCVVTDYRMPQMTGLDLLQALTKLGSRLPVILVTGQGDIPTCSTAFRYGVVDFLEKPVHEAELLTAIQAAVAHSREAQLAQEVHNRFSEQLQSLTERELAVMERLVRGVEMKQIATEFGTTFQTVAKHRQHLMTKLGVEGDVELTRLVLAQLSTKKLATVSR